MFPLEAQPDIDNPGVISLSLISPDRDISTCSKATGEICYVPFIFDRCYWTAALTPLNITLEHSGHTTTAIFHTGYHNAHSDVTYVSHETYQVTKLSNYPKHTTLTGGWKVGDPSISLLLRGLSPKGYSAPQALYVIYNCFDCTGQLN